jgi:hypothetical protein
MVKNANEAATMMLFSATVWKRSCDGSTSTSDESQPISLSKLISIASRIISKSDRSRVINHSSKSMFNLSTRLSPNIVIVSSLVMIIATRLHTRLPSLSMERSQESDSEPANAKLKKKQPKLHMKQ